VKQSKAKEIPLPTGEPRNIGYARVSTEDQNLDLQLKALELAGCYPIFKEKISGVANERPEFEKALAMLKAGDTFVVWKLDRMGRSTLQLLNCVQLIKTKGAAFRSITDNIDTNSPMGECIFTVFAAFAQLERSLIRERTTAGVRSYIEKTGKWGKPKGMSIVTDKKTDELIADWRDQGISMSAIHKRLGVENLCYQTVKARCHAIGKKKVYRTTT
jgi:DNA invertase Pin-like site-specific DNA recombinase